jgi:radical SAM protein with 4Fe4S-binding SPASM domain
LKGADSAPGTRPLVGAEAEAHVERRLGDTMDVLVRFPKYFLIETVNTCNARCIMCGIDFDKKSKTIIDNVLFDGIVDELGRHREEVEKVMLYLDGEPLLDKKLPVKVAKMKGAGIKVVNIATNASILTEKTTRALIEAGLDEIYITIDSMKKDVYEAIRVRLNFDDVLNNTLRFIDLRNQLNPGLRIRVQMIMQELNHTEVPDFRAYWAERLKPTDQVVVQKVHNWASTTEVMKFDDEDQVNNIPCIALWGTCVIHVNGDVPLCCMDTETEHLVGNVGKLSIADIWAGQKMKMLRKKHLQGQRNEIRLCDGCTLWREEKHESETSAIEPT